MNKTNIAIINYGMGNIRSVENAIKKLNFQPKVITNPEELNESGKIILPGVGSFKAAMQLLDQRGWISKIKNNVLEKKKPLLGICLGMQLLADKSEENGITEGLRIIPGEVKSLKNLGCKLKVPQIGWNSVRFINKHKYFAEIKDDIDFYFVNSYVYLPANKSNVIGVTSYGVNFCSAIAKDNISGTQFHPEKSSKSGLKILRNFLNA